jgi:hypothetical protein
MDFVILNLQIHNIEFRLQWSEFCVVVKEWFIGYLMMLYYVILFSIDWDERRR